MVNCKKCEAKDRKIHAQGVLIASQLRELQADRERIKRLETALHEACDYAETCQHFPGKELLESTR